MSWSISVPTISAQAFADFMALAAEALYHTVIRTKATEVIFVESKMSKTIAILMHQAKTNPESIPAELERLFCPSIPLQALRA